MNLQKVIFKFKFIFSRQHQLCNKQNIVVVALNDVTINKDTFKANMKGSSLILKPIFTPKEFQNTLYFN